MGERPTGCGRSDGEELRGTRQVEGGVHKEEHKNPKVSTYSLFISTLIFYVESTPKSREGTSHPLPTSNVDSA